MTDSTRGHALPAFGTLRSLVVYVRFPEDSLPNPEWPWEQTRPPQYAERLFAADSNFIPAESLTAYYKVMSRGRMIRLADTYPEVIVLQHNVMWYQERGGAAAVNEEAIKSLQNVPWAIYDNWSRQNGRFRNEPDGVVDNILVIYRTSPVKLNPSCAWIGANGGVGALFGEDFEVASGMKVKCGSLQSGLTVMGMSSEYRVFRDICLHELAHFYTLHHYSATNDTYGTDFLCHGGWGVAAASGSSSPCANAWDRYTLGWEPVRYDFAANRRVDTVFWLGGIVETGHMARIALPHTQDQYFWLEYHTARNFFDKVDGEQAALYIMHQTGNGPHHLDVEEADGNWDWSLSDSGKVPTYCCGEWQQIIRQEPNPLLGGGDRDILKFDKNADGKISWNDYLDIPVLAIQGEPQFLHYGGDGNDGFLPRRGRNEFSIGTNPGSASNGMRRGKQSGVELNGIKVEVLAVAGDSVQLRYASHEPWIGSSARWCGLITLRDSLVLKKGVTLRLAANKAFTAQEKIPQPTHFILKAGSVLVLDKRARLLLEPGTTLTVEPGAQLVKGKKAKIVVKEGARLEMD